MKLVNCPLCGLDDGFDYDKLEDLYQCTLCDAFFAFGIPEGELLIDSTTTT